MCTQSESHYHVSLQKQCNIFLKYQTALSVLFFSASSGLINHFANISGCMEIPAHISPNSNTRFLFDKGQILPDHWVLFLLLFGSAAVPFL